MHDILILFMMMKGYGSLGQLEQKPDDTEVELSSMSFDPKFPFGEKEIFKKKEFWIEVRTYYKDHTDISRSRAQRIVRTARLKEKFVRDKHPDQDILVHMLTTIHDTYFKHITKQNDSSQNDSSYDTYGTFVYELAEFTSVLLEQDEEKRYDDEFEFPDDSCKTVLHLAAERYLHEVVEVILQKYPRLVDRTCEIDNEDVKPLHLALNYRNGENEGTCCCQRIVNFFKKTDESLEGQMKRKDQTASMLIRAMEKEKVRNEFQLADLEARFYFKDYINNPAMNKTVVALLDCLMDPDWPFMPDNDKDKIEYAAHLPNMPIRFHFHYQLLDGDNEGRPPYIISKDGIKKTVEKFDVHSKTCLQQIAEISNNKNVIEHPAVRLLVRRKWNLYGKLVLWATFALYVFFLMALSTALLVDSKRQDRTVYEGFPSFLRLVAEIYTLIMTVFYSGLECKQLWFERKNYFKVWSNWFDVIGLILIYAIVLLRFSGHYNAEWGVSAFAFFVNFIRIFKYFPIIRPLGVYLKTIQAIITYDISLFVVVFLIVMFAFTGCVFMIFKAEHVEDVGGFWRVFLHETRALTEAQGFDDDYKKFNPWVVFFLMFNMFFIMVVLLNILIGQVSYRYEQALSSAIVWCDVERAKLIASVDSNLQSLRLKHYTGGDFMDDEVLADELMSNWLATKDEEKVRKRKEIVKEMVISKLNLPKEDKQGSLDTPE